MLETFTSETFAGRRGETFHLVPDGQPPFDAALAEVTVLGHSATGSTVPGRGGRSEAFSLVFRAPRGALAPQQIFRVRHDALGEFELFLVPIGPDPDGGGMRYEAVFT